METTVSGLQILSNATVADEEVLQDPGLATFSRSIPAPLIGSTLHMQVLLFDGSTLIDVSTIDEYLISG